MAKKAKNKKVSSFAAAHARRQREAAKAANVKGYSMLDREPSVVKATWHGSADGVGVIGFTPANGGTFSAAEVNQLIRSFG